MSETTRQIRVGCRRNARPTPDGRTREARLLRETRAKLIAHVGGTPSATQVMLIDRVAWLTLRLAQFDTLRAGGEAIDDVLYLAWSNSLSRIMARLGATAPNPSAGFIDVLHKMAAEGPAKAPAA